MKAGVRTPALAAILALWASPLLAQAQVLSEVALPFAAPGFGGLSAIHVSQSGREAVVLSDRGRLFTVALRREGGRVTGAGLTAETVLTDGDGNRDPDIRAFDSEGLARMRDGRFAISFEGAARVAVFSGTGRAATVIAPPPEAARLPANGGYEALAVDAQGRFYMLAERGDGRLWRGGAQGWEVIATVGSGGGLRPVALDFDDRGRLYLLERRVSLGGFGNRLTRFAVGPSGLGAPERLLDEGSTRHGNLEGLSLWRDGQGRLIASMIADNDLSRGRPNTLVEYVLPD
ncbi:esterase-like activity of phytase family protein [Maritalea mobilis]|uniref:esterase-like activity of phytase family protein n=1 Tax=Maritalea mobilis TaxID=483324 RepID=UPI001C96CF3A|nr:esterase-like activity of phytase family protein [Maritalea mobilis]MBY6202891.1 esterase-like activity of phytase family protein [Maritalea mobilis]